MLPRSLANDDFAGIARALAAYDRTQQEAFTTYTVQFLAAE